MKKNLNIAYLNGAEGLLRRGGSSSGGSGGSGESGGETSTVEYLDVSGLDVTNGTINKFLGCASLVKISSYGMIMPPAISAPLLPYVDKIKIDFNEKVSLGSEFVSLKTLILSLEDSINQEEQLNAIPRITKEQFYSLE